MPRTHVVPIARASGRGRQPLAVERLVEAQLEISALHAERDRVGVELRALSARIQLAIHAEHPGIALHVAGRLDALGDSLIRRGEAA